MCERVSEISHAADRACRLRVAAMLAATARPGPPTAGRRGRGDKRVKLAPELMLEKPVEVVHL
jgi:hypothetical protein